MKNNRIFLVWLLTSLLFSFSCQHIVNNEGLINGKDVKAEGTVLDVVSFESDTIYAFKLDNPSPDTFKLVSHSWYFFYPYGKFATPEELKSHYRNSFKFEEEVSPSNSDLSGEVTLYRLKMGNGFVKFFHTTWEEDSENNDMAVVAAKITEPSIQMTDGLKVGMTRDEVKAILFSKGEPAGIRNYKNLLIATTLDGIWVNLSFEKDRLNRILIDTDYLLNKE